LTAALGLLPFANRSGENGGVAIAGDAATISGQVATDDIRRQLVAQATTAARGLSLSDNLTVNLSTRFPSFIEKLDAGKFTLDMTVPDQAAKDRLGARAVELFGAGKFIDNVKVAAAGAGPSFAPDWLDRMLNVLGLLKRFGNQGEIKFDGQSVTLNGQVATQEIKTRLLQEIAVALPGINIIDQITVVESLLSESEAKVQADLKQQLADKTIEFDLNSDKITPAGAAILDQVVPILDAKPDANIEITGHTDITGSEKLNQDLSQRRAASVKRYLIGKGISASRLNPVGYGSSHPVADNGTEEGRARNRRIEFRVTPGKAAK
jgi:OOP family OmpA-OmpF porin